MIIQKCLLFAIITVLVWLEKPFFPLKAELLVLSSRIQTDYHSFETMRGDADNGTRRVVYRQMPGGLCNSILGVVSSMIAAIVLNTPLFCMIK